MLTAFINFLEKGVNLVGAFDLKIIFVLFLLFAIGESTGLSVPYLIETTWLLAGFQLLHSELSLPKLLLLFLAAQLGRQFGGVALYYAVRGGEGLLARHTGRLLKFSERFRKKTDLTAAMPSAPFLHKLNLLSPLSVAVGMLLWMRIPLAVFLSVKGQLKLFLEATSLAGLVYDVTFVGIGAILGTTTKLKPWQMIPYFMAVMLAIGIIMFVTRRIVSSLNARKKKDSLEQLEP